MNEQPNPNHNAPVMRAKRCQTCRFAEREMNPASGKPEMYCHRHPPHASPVIGQTTEGPVVAGLYTHFPVVQAQHWCGEWAAQGPEVIVPATASRIERA